MSVHCPNCGTSFPVDKAPWTQQKVHCPKHDRLHLPSEPCEFCTEEEAAQVKEAGDKAAADKLAEVA